MNVNAFLHSLAILLTISVVCVAQEARCSVDIKRSPVLRGLKLKMPERDVARMFKVDSLMNLAADDKRTGGDSMFVRLSFRTLDQFKDFDDIEALWLDFYKSKLAKIEIRYSKEAGEFEDVRAFVSVLSAKFDISPSFWTFAGQPQKATLSCPEFELEAYSNGHLTLSDLKALEEKRRNFRP